MCHCQSQMNVEETTEVGPQPPPQVLRASRASRLTMFGDVADRRVIFVLEVSISAASALPAAKADLIEALLRLAYRGDADTSFNLLHFGGRELVQWSDRMVLATPRTATVAAQWIRDLKPDDRRHGCPSLLDALTAAMSDPACQAVHVVTTGETVAAATGGSSGDLPSELRRRLGNRKLRPIHCAACLPTPEGLDRLCDLAAGTGGSVATVQLDNEAGVHSVTRLLTADRPSARLGRDSCGRLRNLEAPIGAQLVSSSRALVLRPSSAKTTPTAAASALEATLIGRSVLARRFNAGRAFYYGRVVSEVSPRVLLVEFSASSSDSSESERQETRLADLVSLDDALRRPVEPGDFVLAPAADTADCSGVYRPARVLRTAGRDGVGQVTVAMVAAGGVRRLEPGRAAWIPRELYCALELEELAAAAALAEAVVEQKQEQQQHQPAPNIRAEPTQAAEVAKENSPPAEKLEEAADEQESATKRTEGTNRSGLFQYDLFEEDEDRFGSPVPPPPSQPSGRQLSKRAKRQPHRATFKAHAADADAETPRVEAYRRAMEAARLTEIRRRRAELEADGLLRDPCLRRSEAAAIAAATAAASPSGRGALHTAAVIEARLRRQERREAAELRHAEADAEAARHRWWCEQPRSGQQRLRPEPPPPPEVLRLRRLRLLAGDGEQLLLDGADERHTRSQLAKPDKTIAEWLLYQRMANGGTPMTQQQQQQLEQQQQQQRLERERQSMTAQQWLRMTRRAEQMIAVTTATRTF